jgi:hypothetical protein
MEARSQPTASAVLPPVWRAFGPVCPCSETAAVFRPCAFTIRPGMSWSRACSADPRTGQEHSRPKLGSTRWDGIRTLWSCNHSAATVHIALPRSTSDQRISATSLRLCPVRIIKRMTARSGAETTVLGWREKLVCSRRGGRQADLVVTGTRRDRAKASPWTQFWTQTSRYGPKRDRTRSPFAPF